MKPELIKRTGDSIEIEAPYNGRVDLLCTSAAAAERLEQVLRETLHSLSVFEE